MTDFMRRAGRMVCGVALLAACQGDRFASPAIPEIDDVFWDLRFDHHAIMLSTASPYDTVTITATPRSHTRVPLTGLPAPEYVSTDARRVVVTAEGKLIALSPTAAGSHSMVKIIATLTAGNLKHVDTAYVKVVADPNPPQLESITARPAPPDSTKRAVNMDYLGYGQILRRDAIFGYPLPITAKDTDGEELGGVLAFVEAVDTMVGYFAGFHAGGKSRRITESGVPSGDFINILSFQARLLGYTKFITSTMAFGVVKVDTVEFRFGWPLAATIDVFPSPSRGPGNFFMEDPHSRPGVDVKIGVGGVIMWRVSGATEETEVVFDDPTHVRPADEAGDFFNTPLCTSVELSPSGAPKWGDCSEGGNFVLPIRPSVANLEDFAVFRSFPVPGVYEFRNARNGARGRITVVDER